MTKMEHEIEVLPPIATEPDGSRQALVRALAMMLIELATVPVPVVECSQQRKVK